MNTPPKATTNPTPRETITSEPWDEAPDMIGDVVAVAKPSSVDDFLGYAQYWEYLLLMAAERVVELHNDSLERWKDATSAERKEQIARIIAASDYLKGKMNEDRRKLINGATNATQGDKYFIPEA